MQVQAWDIPFSRPIGQSTELTLKYAKEAIQRRNSVIKATEKCTNEVFECLKMQAKPRRTGYTTEEQVADRLAMHLIAVPHVTEDCINAFAEVANSCYIIDMSTYFEIGFDSLSECLSDNSATTKFILEIAGSSGVALLSELSDKYTLKPFSRLGMQNFFVHYAFAFIWLNDPKRECRPNAKEKINAIDNAYKNSSAAEENIDSIESRMTFLRQWFENNKDLKDISSPIPSCLNLVISKIQLLRLIEIAGKSSNCCEFLLPSGCKNDSDCSVLLRKYGFQPTLYGPQGATTTIDGSFMRI